jgi:hypothetical protein
LAIEVLAILKEKLEQNEAQSHDGQQSSRTSFASYSPILNFGSMNTPNAKFSLMQLGRLTKSISPWFSNAVRGIHIREASTITLALDENSPERKLRKSLSGDH